MAADQTTSEPANGAEVAQEAIEPLQLKRGDLVSIQGLKIEELNNVQAELHRFDEETSRWEVKLADGEIKAIKPSNLVFKGMSSLEDDGTLALVSMASDQPMLQKLLNHITNKGLKEASEGLQLSGQLVANSAALTLGDDNARIYHKLGHQAEQKVRGCLEDLQRCMESVDSVDVSDMNRREQSDFRMARKDLVRFVQSAQERLEGALERLRPVLKRLAVGATKKHGWSSSDDVPLQEKYRAAFAKLTEESDRVENKGNLAAITVKYQGKGDNPPPSDNLYVKGLPGWVTEEDIKTIFSEVAPVMSLKLKTAEWGAIAFVRMPSRKDAARSIALFNGNVPQRLVQKVEAEENRRQEGEKSKAALRATVEQLARGAFITFSLEQPLGIIFNDDMRARTVQAGSQAALQGVRKDWRARDIGGVEVTSPEALKERIELLKNQGLVRAVIAFQPPPLVITYNARPFGLVVARDPDTGLIYVNEAVGNSHARGVRSGAILSAVEGKDVQGKQQEEVAQMLRELPLPATVIFEQAVSLSEGVTVLDGEAPDAEDKAALLRRPRAPVSAAPVEIRVVDLQLSEPLGVGFNDALTAKEVKAGSQGDRLGVKAGWRLLSAGGERLTVTKELVLKLGALKKEGVTSVKLTFAASTPEEQTPTVDIEVDVNQPLGIMFNESLLAQDVKEGHQAFEKGVRSGWKVKSLDKDEMITTKEFVAKLQELKALGVETATVTFEPPAESEEPPAKKAKTE